MAKYVKVELPVRQPDPTLYLCGRIIAKHTSDGAASPFTDVIDMVAFIAFVNDVKTKRSDAVTKDELALDKYDDANNKAGLAAGQNKDTKNTIQWYVRQIKDLLLIKHNGTEEAMNSYGFVVIISTTGARKNIKIELPNTLKEMIELGEDIVDHHTTLGVGSPLTAALVDMVAFEALVVATRTLYDAWEILRDEVQALNNDALNTLGYAPGQTISSVGTIYNELSKIRLRLLQKHQGREESLSLWGFKALITESTPGRKKGSRKISIKGQATDSETDEPLPNALIYLEEIDTFTLTDEDGNFSYENLEDGTYTMHGQKTGYDPTTVENVVVVAGTVTTVNIELTVEGAGFTGTISGLVTAGGVPAQANISVLGMVGGTTTDPSGNYLLTDVPQGTQSVRAILVDDPTQIITTPAIVTAGGNVVVNFVFP